MSSIPLGACLPPEGLYEESGIFPRDAGLREYEDMADTAVVVEEDSIALDAMQMNIGQYYLAVIANTPYLYRRINDKEIEVYGMVRED